MTSLLNTAELTALHTETLADMSAQAQIARTLTNISRRAATLLTTGGYTAELFAGGLYHVYGPQGQHYMTTCDPIMGYHCDCPAFATYTTCKHLEAIDLMQRDEAQASAYDLLHADADDDAYAEF